MNVSATRCPFSEVSGRGPLFSSTSLVSRTGSPALRICESVITGPLASATGAWDQAWLHAKLLFVLLLSGYHGWLSAYARKLARGERPLDGKRLRLLNEVPGIAVAIIVVLVVVKPF